jgi:hypothetical protein
MELVFRIDETKKDYKNSLGTCSSGVMQILTQRDLYTERELTAQAGVTSLINIIK